MVLISSNLALTVHPAPQTRPDLHRHKLHLKPTSDGVFLPLSPMEGSGVFICFFIVNAILKKEEKFTPPPPSNQKEGLLILPTSNV